MTGRIAPPFPGSTASTRLRAIGARGARGAGFAVALMLGAAASGPARAAESYDNCTAFIDALPAVIGTQGTWCLRKDLATSIASGNAITVTNHNVTLDCNHFKIGGLAAGAGTFAVGVVAVDRMNVTIRHCNIRGFRTGIAITGAAFGGHEVSDNRIEGNRVDGLVLAGSGNTVRGNRVFDTGGAPETTGFFGMRITGDADVIDNLVDGVFPGPDRQSYGSTGIYASFSTASVIRGNRIRGIDGGVATAHGITLSGGSAATVHDNDIALGGGGGDSGIRGIYCAHTAVVTGNRIQGMQVGLLACTDDGGNVVKP